VKIYNTDCFTYFEKEKDKTIDLVLVDLPYGQTACKWDSLIDLNKMWIELKRICKSDCIYIFFCTTKFGYKLIQSNERWFKYDLVWEKSRKVGFLSANKMPLRKHEMIYVFADSDKESKPLDCNQNIRDYAKFVKQFINKPINDIIKDVNNTQISHFFTNGYQFELPTEKTYNKLIEKYNLQDMPGFRDYQSLKDEWEKIPKTPLTYNPQKTNGKRYTCKQGKQTDTYGIDQQKRVSTDNKGDRHPHSILQFEEPTHEMVYVFADGSQDEERKPLDFNQNIRDYAKCIKQFINKPIKDIIKDVNNTGISHFFTNGHQFRMILENDYNKLIEKYKLQEMPEFRDYQSLKDEWKKIPKIPKTPLTYNPQKTEGTSYKTNGMDLTKSYYRGGEKEYKSEPINNKGDRHPTTILKFNNPKKSLHRTQKPTDLCEWLIKTYSNEGDNVLDFTMGSGTTGIACINTNRNFIGVELDKEIFKVARHRLFKHELEKIKSTAYT
jgi:DNA modification methylase